MPKPMLTLSGRYRRPCYKRLTWWNRVSTIVWLEISVLQFLLDHYWLASLHLCLAISGYWIYWCYGGWQPQPEYRSFVRL